MIEGVLCDDAGHALAAPPTLGARLALAREAAGFTRSDAAWAIEMSYADLCLHEDDLRPVTDAELAAYAFRYRAPALTKTEST